VLTLKQGIRLSAIIDKLDLTISNPEGTQEEVGSDLIMQLVRKAHKAEKEICAFVADTNKCSIEEAENVNLIEFIKGLFSDPGVVDFFKSAVNSKDQG
jgi:hypothetical protein